MTQVEEIPLSSLFVDERNVRHGDDVDVGNLAEDIGENGVLQPIVVRETDDGYGVVAGSRRYKASKKAGLDSMPCIVRDLDDDRAVALSVLENHSREDVEPRDQVKAIERYFEESDRVWTDKDKKDKLTAPVSEGGFGFPRQTANDYLSILNVDEKVRKKYNLSAESGNTDACIEEKLDVSKARKVGRELKEFSAEEQEKVIQEIEDKSFEESKEVIEEVSAKVEQREAEDVEQALEMVSMPDGSDDPVVENLSETDAELMEECVGIAENDSLSKNQKLVKAIELELPQGLSLDFESFVEGRSGNKDLYKIYLTFCNLKNKYPRFVFNGNDVVTFRRIREFAEESEKDLDIEGTLEEWGEVSVTGNLSDSEFTSNGFYADIGSSIAGQKSSTVSSWAQIK